MWYESELLGIKITVAMANPNLRYVEWWFTLVFVVTPHFSHRDKVNANETAVTLEIACNVILVKRNLKTKNCVTFPFLCIANFIYVLWNILWVCVCVLLRNRCVHCFCFLSIVCTFCSLKSSVFQCNWLAAFFLCYFYRNTLPYCCDIPNASTVLFEACVNMCVCVLSIQAETTTTHSERTTLGNVQSNSVRCKSNFK